MNLNKVFLVGRLTKDPEGRTTPSGKPVTNFSIANNRVWTDATGNKQEATEYHNIVLWGRLAEISAQYLVKGQEVLIEGRLQTRSWEAQDGTKRYTTEIIAEGMQMGSKPQGARSGGYSQNQNSYSAPAPAQSAPVQQDPSNDFFQQDAISSHPMAEGAGSEEVKIENIPF